MLVGIYQDSYGKFRDFLKRYETILDYNKIAHIRLDSNNPNFWNQVSKLDLFIFRWGMSDTQKQIAKSILPIVEKELGVKCFPNMATCWHFDDKIRQYYLLKQKKIPIIPSWIFWDRDAALQWFREVSLPIVFKLRIGAGSNNVILIKKRQQGKKLINIMFKKGIATDHIPDSSNIFFSHLDIKKLFYRWGGMIKRKIKGEDMWPFWQREKNYVYFQKFLPNNNYDTRVTVLGDRAFAFQRFNRKNDFRASGSGRINYSLKDIDLNIVKSALDVSQIYQFQSMAYDMIYDESKSPFIIEISYTYLAEAIVQCPGYWDLDLNFHEGHFWPQYFHLMDALELWDLKQPPN